MGPFRPVAGSKRWASPNLSIVCELFFDGFISQWKRQKIDFYEKPGKP